MSKHKMLFRVPGLLLCVAFLAVSCAKAPEESTGEVTALWSEKLPESPADAVWDKAPRTNVALILQDLVEPRLMTPSTTRLHARVVTDGERMAFRLEWDDATGNEIPITGMFPDACAVQLPRESGPDLPAPQMGETGRLVEITYWRASWQAEVDGELTDDIRSLYPNAKPDHYPYQAQSLEPESDEQKEMELRYAPAEAVGNAMAGPRTQPVQDLLAEGPGTLTPAEQQVSTGSGARTTEGWQVMMVRPAPSWLARGAQSQVAFAVWDGEADETGARKMRSVWIPFAVPEVSDDDAH
jgi:hypothetical protein